MLHANSPRKLVALDAPQVHEHLEIANAVAVLDDFFMSDREVSVPARTHLSMGDGTLLTMPAAGRVGGDRVIGGVKVVTIRSANAELGVPTVQAVYLLFGGETLAPLAVIDGPALTNLRTSAVSALATTYLARPEAATLVIFGAGAQGFAHLAALHAVRPIANVIVISRTASKAEELVTAARGMGLRARIGEPADVAAADLVCCCTTSRQPLFDGTLLQPGTHVVAVGAYQPDMRELDEVTMNRGAVVVEDRGIALAEAGELAIPAAAGRPIKIVADLAELCSGTRVRTDADDITVFKSVGMASEDLVLADALYQAATR